MTLIFDIETGPLPDEKLVELFTFDEAKVTGFALLSQEFDPAAVKTGNLKDPVKIQEKIEKARKEFSLKKRTAEIALEEGRADAWNAFIGKAALSPLTGQMLAVGIWDNNAEKGKEMIISCVDDFFSEQELVEATLGLLESRILSGRQIIGHNIIAFDLPFLIRRGLFYGHKPPIAIMNQLEQYRPQCLLDTMRYWQFGNRSEQSVSLDKLAQFFGTTRKNGSGALFYKKFFGTSAERTEALEYLYNDIVMTVEIATKLGVLP